MLLASNDLVTSIGELGSFQSYLSEITEEKFTQLKYQTSKQKRINCVCASFKKYTKLQQEILFFIMLNSQMQQKTYQLPTVSTII